VYGLSTDRTDTWRHKGTGHCIPRSEHRYDVDKRFSVIILIIIIMFHEKNTELRMTLRDVYNHLAR